ncbi:MAG: VanW family protein [Chloroflexota bacterium]|nr:VanW family protein [Chloroflexota bacterium]
MQTISYQTSKRSRIKTGPADFAALFALVLVITLLGAFLFWQYWHADRIYSGVTIGGIPVGGMTRAAAMAAVERGLARQSLSPITVAYAGRQWPVATGQVMASADALAAVNEAYLVGRQGDTLTRLAAQLGAALGQADVEPALDLDVPQLRYALSQIAADVRTPAQRGVQVAGFTVPPQPGVDVDVEMTLEGLAAQLEDAVKGAPVTAELAVVPLEPPPVVEATSAGAETLALTPLILRDARFGYEFALDPAAVQTLLYSSVPPRLDEDRARALLEQWAEQIDIAPADARLRFDPNSSAVSVMQPSRSGRKLDVDGTLASLRESVEKGAMTAALIIQDVSPAVDSNRVAEMGIRELVASGTTYFAGSSPARVRNIEVAAEKFDGHVIPPGGIFSFNEVVEDVSSANGFEDSLIIWGDRTAVGVGGGVCQVSTTVFRAAYAGGFPIVERYNHGYVVDWYGEPGLDATIYTPSVDLRFRNDTGAYLLIQPVVNGTGGTITFNFYGTKPDRQVTISEPEIADVSPPPEPLYEVDESLALDERRQVDWAKEGMTVTVTRTIVENGETRTETLRSKYQPWRAVYLVGPGTEIPATPTPSATAEAVEEEGSEAMPASTPSP